LAISKATDLGNLKPVREISFAAVSFAKRLEFKVLTFVVVDIALIAV
jgi:hypothetical protein